VSDEREECGPTMLNVNPLATGHRPRVCGPWPVNVSGNISQRNRSSRALTGAATGARNDGRARRSGERFRNSYAETTQPSSRSEPLSRTCPCIAPSKMTWFERLNQARKMYAITVRKLDQAVTPRDEEAFGIGTVHGRSVHRSAHRV
jgi:hypothetical protein